jgi:hypothetical protein
VGYVQILKKGSLIWHKYGNWGRWTIFGLTAAPIRGPKSIAGLVLGRKNRHLWDRGIIPVTEVEETSAQKESF